jgi:hypothetical protein
MAGERPRATHGAHAPDSGDEHLKEVAATIRQVVRL